MWASSNLPQGNFRDHLRGLTLPHLPLWFKASNSYDGWCVQSGVGPSTS